MTPVASLTNVVKAFGDVRAVDGLTLRVQPGETVALLGPNGAGKTTTISLLLRLLTADRGSARLFGVEPAEAAAAGRVGAMLQDGGLMSGVLVGELLAMLAGLYPAPIPFAEAITIAQLQGLERRRVDRLSGGQSQRLRVAAALMGDPDLLILDEPTAAMDVEARRSFWQAMRAETARGRTILFSTHYLEEADAYSDRVVVIGAGTLLADGTPDTIKASTGLRVLRCTLTDPDPARLADLPGVAAVDVRQHRAEIRSRDSDSTLRALLSGWPDSPTSKSQGLEDAFLALTAAH
jgi:ABC-2 type transport system ATP-binding protein